MQGATHSSEKGILNFEIDQRISHIAGLPFKKFQLQLSEAGKIDSCRVALDFNLTSFMQYLRSFNDMGWLFISKQMLKKASMFDLGGGIFSFDIGYHNGLLNYEIRGDHLSSHTFNFDNFILIGKKQGDTWMVEDFILDKFELSAEIQSLEEKIALNFFGLKYQDNVLLGLEGTWNEQSNLLKTHVHLMEWNFGDEKKWQDLFLGRAPKGTLRGQGDVNIQILPHAPWVILIHLCR